MAEIRVADGPIDRFDAVATLIGVAAVVGIAYWCDRTYSRWLKENHPFAGHRARVERWKTGYQQKRANVTEVAQIISDVLDEVARATR